MSKYIDEIASKRLKEVAEDIQETAKQLAPVETGFMRDQIELRRLGMNGWVVGIWGDNFPGEFYPAIVSYGKENTPPNPFMDMAYARHQYEALSLLPFIIGVDIETVAKGYKS
ncbi:MAG: hypothetical protein BGO49_24915 [Planctomycetales bacterium 71-10]|nr:MAG: hypothetical protein BGO49_24915 [Planctomycetales bacterium 71-10]